jgi:hypothetical protein
MKIFSRSFIECRSKSNNKNNQLISTYQTKLLYKGIYDISLISINGRVSSYFKYNVNFISIYKGVINKNFFKSNFRIKFDTWGIKVSSI